MAVSIAAGAATVVLPAPAAYAHGVGGSSETVGGFVWLGFTHMLLGWDHLLFVAGVVLLAGQVRQAAKLISLFALGHSITLFTATVAGWQVNAVLVDAVIALSVVFVGVVGLIGRPKNWTWFAAAVTAFGLVHGLGLSTRLQAIGLPEDGLIPRVLAFNVGVEIGQLLAVLGLFMLGDVARHYITWRDLPRASNVALVLAGVVTAMLVPVIGGDAPGPAQAVGSDCQTRDRTETYPAGGGHPATDFAEPGEPSPDESFGHVLGDGFVIVHYQPTLPADQLAELRFFVTDPQSGPVVASAKEQPEVVKAVNAYTTLTCTAFDMHALRHFTAVWFGDPRSEPVVS